MMLDWFLELEEDGVRIALTIVDTPGFGDNIDNEFASVRRLAISKACLTFNRFQEIVGYLERQYDDILAEESRIRRNPRFRDNRVHALLYFIPPTGHACVYRAKIIGVHELKPVFFLIFVASAKWTSSSCAVSLPASTSSLLSARLTPSRPVNLKGLRRGSVILILSVLVLTTISF